MSGAEQSHTSRIVMPGDTNHLGTLYGGTLMAWMDTAAAVAGVRRAGSEAVVTAAVDGLVFRVPIRQGELVDLVSSVESVGRTSMRVRVEAHREDPATRSRQLCTEATFTMVAIDASGAPTAVREASSGA